MPMPFTIEDFHDFVRILEERPEWRTELRRLVFTDELLALPERMAESRALTEQRFQELADAQRRTEEQITILTRVVGVLVDDVGQLKGDMLELRYRARAASYLGRVVRRLQTLSTDELSALLDDAVDQEQLSDTEKDEIMLADLVVRGRRRDDGSPVYLVVEISSGVGLYDGERAVQRAALLSKLGTPALPVVAGRTVTDAAARLARTQHVWQVTDGQVIPPEPAAASV